MVNLMVTIERSPTNNAGAWLFGNQAYVEDDLCARTDIHGATHDWFDYNFNIPLLAVITSVKVKPVHAVRLVNERLDVRVSWDGGLTWSPASQIQNVATCATATQDELEAIGLTTWTPDKLSNANFRVRVRYIAGAGCFSLDSLIRMFDGSDKPLEQVKVGDKVLSWTRGKGHCEAVVTVVTKHQFLNPYELVKALTTKGSLSLAGEHMACVTKEHTFKEAFNLKKGDSLLTFAETLDKINAVEKTLHKSLINLQTDTGTLYVNGYLVHNIIKVPW